LSDTASSRRRWCSGGEGAEGWTQAVIEPEFLRIEAGGAAADIDGDGDLDVVFGGDGQSDELWWWENPAPQFDPATPWKRRLIKKGGARQHHDQCIADFLGTGRPQLAFWNQRAKTLFLAEIPADPRAGGEWAITPILTNAQPGKLPYIEGASAFDIDADGRVDLLACNTWFKHTGGKEFKAVRFAENGGLIFAGYFKPAKYPQIVISPGDGPGPVRIYECTGQPDNPADWQGRDLLDRPIEHGHSLQLGDVNRDGHLDIFLGEMAKWGRTPQRDNPGATAWVLFGDGQGNFTTQELVVGHGWHEARLADLDGDGDLDLLNKPYTWDAPRVDAWLNGGTRRGARGSGTSASFPGPVGLQLWSLRETFSQNVPLGLQTARGLGFQDVELAGLYGLPPAQLRSMLAAHGLRAVAGHWGYKQVAGELAQVTAEAKALGVKYVGVGMIPRSGSAPLTEAQILAAGEVFNRAGAALTRAGLQFVYHVHGHEFAPHGENRTLFDLLAEKTDPRLVAFEMDVFWTVHAGQDPVKVMRKHPGRWPLLHVKDMKPGTKGDLSGRTDKANDYPVGSGMVDVIAALREGVKQGTRHYFIEDESPQPLRQIPQSLRYLEALAW
jgi:sugar phosphate isomerase/epimerase